jgi:hypothetical protein
MRGVIGKKIQKTTLTNKKQQNIHHRMYHIIIQNIGNKIGSMINLDKDNNFTKKEIGRNKDKKIYLK